MVLRRTLKGHRGEVTRIAWANDGRRLASPSRDGTVRIWDTETGLAFLEIPAAPNLWVTDAAWSPTGKLLATSSGDKRIRIWDVVRGSRVRIRKGRKIRIDGTALAWSPDGGLLAVSDPGGGFSFWETVGWTKVRSVRQPSEVICFAWSPDGELLATARRRQRDIEIWDSLTAKLNLTLSGHSGPVNTVAWSPNGKLIASGSGGQDRTIRIWPVSGNSGHEVFEGHTGAIRSISYSADGRLIASKAMDDTVRLWHAETGRLLVTLAEEVKINVTYDIRSRRPPGIAFHPSHLVLATLGNDDREIRIWDVDLERLLRADTSDQSLKYTTARIALLGDSGVGKTGLGWRLAHGVFKEHSSTHGQQFWVLGDLGITRNDGTECEAVLWDLAGQPDYRLVHTLFLDDVDLALLLFDPGNRQEALKGVEYWLKALAQSIKRERKTILVGARLDRAEPVLTHEELIAFCAHHGVTGGYIGTSASTGRGLDELVALMKQQVPWQALTATVTTTTFKRIKDSVLNLKARPELNSVLVDADALRARLEASDADWRFSDEELMTAVQHLANHGYVSVLRGSHGDHKILLAPEVISNLALSLVLEARRNPRGLGAIEEERLLHQEYSLPEIAGLPQAERDILIDAVAFTFLSHNICFRETLGTSSFLIFPSLINQKKPLLDATHTSDDVSYTITGAIDNIYAMLVVLLGYTNTFTRTNQWQNQAQYEFKAGEVCGFRQTSEREGEMQVVHYYSKNTRPQTKVLFQALFESFLRDKNISFSKYDAVFCPKCSYRAEREEVIKRINERKEFLYCGECGARIGLALIAADRVETPKSRRALDNHLTAKRRTVFESALVRIKALRRNRHAGERAPNCFISYAWGDARDERWVATLAMDLQDGGVQVTYDRKDNAAIGASVPRFIGTIESSDFVVVVGTPSYREKYENKHSRRGTTVAAEVDLINVRLTGTEELKATVLPLLLSGEENASLPPLMRGRVYADFRIEAKYFEALLELVLTLCGIPFEDPMIPSVRELIRIEDEDEQ